MIPPAVVAGAILFLLGIHGMVLRPHLLRKIMAANVMGAGVFLLLVGAAARRTGEVDPVPQAMVLTGIVVSVSVTAFALVLARRVFDRTGHEDVSGD